MMVALTPKSVKRPGPAASRNPERAGAPATSRAIDLLPVPAMIVELGAAGLAVESSNPAMAAVGLVPQPGGRSPLIGELGGQIAAFVASGGTRDEFSWRHGDAVDCRQFRVHLARARTLAGRPRCLITLIDQTGEMRTEQSLRREMLTDSLSGLPNRAGFSELIESTIEGGGQDPARFAVMVVNLNRFSRVNACLGALAGDELLITVARRIRGALRGRDTLARTGGDEFGILLALDSGPDDADHVAKRILNAFATPFRLSDYEIRVSCAIGIAFGGDAVENVEDLIRHAQFAVKRSKASGAVETYQIQALDRAREEFAMETALRRALDRNSLKLHFQPIIELATGRITAFEALARWTDEDGNRIAPNDFIPVAEESGLIVPLGRWAMAQAAATLAEWDARAGGNCGVNIAVNISAIQLQRDNVPRMVERALADAAMPGDRFVLELTESALIADPDRVQQIMQALKALGTTLAMDDFGTGYSNLTYLQKLPIDMLKMDRSFVTGMLADRDKLAIVRAILSLAQALGMRTTAEGVETEELARTLAALGCSHAQGYAYAPALEAEAAYTLLESRNS